MRIDEKGNPHTLEQDIIETWAAHGWELISENVEAHPRKVIWTIVAKGIEERKSH